MRLALTLVIGAAFAASLANSRTPNNDEFEAKTAEKHVSAEAADVSTTPGPCDYLTPYDNKTLVIAMETSFETSTPMFYLFNVLVDSLDVLTQTYPCWFDTYIIVPFDSRHLRKGFDYIPTGTCPGDDPDHIPPIFCPETKCPRPIGAVLSSILYSPEVVTPDSVIVVITNSAIEDYAIVEDRVISMIADTTAHVHFAITPSVSPCSLDASDPGIQAINRIASVSGGSVNSVIPVNLGKYFSDFLPTLYPGN